MLRICFAIAVLLAMPTLAGCSESSMYGNNHGIGGSTTLGRF